MSDVTTFTRDHFRSDLSPDEARALFERSVRYVEIETHSFCNRKCWFCGNKDMPQRQDRANNKIMPESLFLKIVDDLASVKYAGQIQYGRYQEPLAEKELILTRIRQAAERLPRAWQYLHTNGDYLTRDYLDELRSVGLGGIELQCYLGNNDQYDEQKMLTRRQQILDRLGLRLAKVVCHAPGIRHQHETDYEGMSVRIDCRNFSSVGTDRGGMIQIRQTPRTAPCLVMFESMYVGFDGSVTPCCNIRADEPTHASSVVSRLQDGSSIFDAYAALHGWRLGLMRFGEKSGPCATCRYNETDVGPEAAEGLERIWQMAISAT